VAVCARLWREIHSECLSRDLRVSGGVVVAVAVGYGIEKSGSPAFLEKFGVRLS